ncbi:hypothetical protein C1G86_1532 [Dehalococcoides mccartyi]|uniref:Uncharacterized protein n=1 Tax=Dehalococcoides mccartyi TaxID=61435 RepID=A0A328ELA7_9CHLR|nr:hypothetical protein [Dehalococcoides mccartyi]RAL68806.1 hypothetical protein C1G87_1569 [Dehalococcoides mccartyi]RAL70008.1 hypothetical protein C1G86_1532 [Dehalococcoides mccartyi]
MITQWDFLVLKVQITVYVRTLMYKELGIAIKDKPEKSTTNIK